MRVEVEIETKDPDLVLDFFESENTISTSKRKSIGEGIIITYQGTLETLAEPGFSLIRVILDIGVNVSIGIASGLVSAWLYDKLKERNVTKLRIERTEVDIDQQEIRRILTEKIETH